jgi:hypothetical protein
MAFTGSHSNERRLRAGGWERGWERGLGCACQWSSPDARRLEAKSSREPVPCGARAPSAPASADAGLHGPAMQTDAV